MVIYHFNKVSHQNILVINTPPIDTKSAKEVYLYSHGIFTILYKKFPTYTEAALYLGCHRKTIYRYIDSNKLYLNKWIISSKLLS